MRLTGRRYSTKDAYYALDDSQGQHDVHGQRIWGSKVPNKVKIFSWLYFKDRLSTRTNLFAKNILDDEICERCLEAVEDMHHVFFECHISAGVWSKLNLNTVANLSDIDVWNATVPIRLDAKLWPFVLQTILWRLWDARNGAIFRHETPSVRTVISKICDDLLVWRRRLRCDQDICNLNFWRCYFLSCNSLDNTTSVVFG
jgi:hypothetical protein